MMSSFARLLMLLFGVCCCFGGSLRAVPASWPEETIRGIQYTSMDALRSFFAFSPMKSSHKGYRCIGSKGMKFEYRHGSQDIYLNDLKFVLSYPVLENAAGETMIAALDVNKVIAPVVRPQYIKNAGQLRCVVIDAGHGGRDAGACNGSIREADLNLALAKKLKALLLKSGFQVVMTRETDVFLTLQQRVDIANRYQDAIFVCLHHNSARSSASGIETFTLAPQGTTSPFARSQRDRFLTGNRQDSTNIALAAAVHSTAILYSKAEDRGIQRARFSVLCTVRHPAILFEGGFVTNPREVRLLVDPDYQKALALAIHNGIVRYRNVMLSKGAARPSTKGKPALRGGATRAPSCISAGKASRLRKER